MDITLNGVSFRNGKFISTPLNLTQRSDGSWHATNFDAMRLGHHGCRILDINTGSFASGGIECGSARAASAGSDKPIQSLDDADGNLVRWLDSMLAWQNQDKAGSSQTAEVLKILQDIVKQM